MDSRLRRWQPREWMNEELRELRCPGCRSIDWTHDGFALREAKDGTVTRERLQPSGGPTADCWSCTQCGHDIPYPATLARDLTRAQVAHPE